MKEEWRPIYDGVYEVSNIGRVRRAKPAKGARVGKVLKQYLSGGRRYLTVTINLQGVGRPQRVHQLVAVAFLGKRPEGYEVDHKDGNRFNNAASNLRYATRQENADNAAHEYQRGEDHHRARLTEKDVRVIRAMSKEGYSYPQIAERFGVCVMQICRIVHGERWRHVT